MHWRHESDLGSSGRGLLRTLTLQVPEAALLIPLGVFCQSPGLSCLHFSICLQQKFRCPAVGQESLAADDTYPRRDHNIHLPDPLMFLMSEHRPEKGRETNT